MTNVSDSIEITFHKEWGTHLCLEKWQLPGFPFLEDFPHSFEQSLTISLNTSLLSRHCCLSFFDHLLLPEHCSNSTVLLTSLLIHHSLYLSSRGGTNCKSLLLCWLHGNICLIVPSQEHQFTSKRHWDSKQGQRQQYYKFLKERFFF